MPLQTKKVFEALATAKLLKKVPQQFVLVGGTALSIHIKHRLSEDLDFFQNGYHLDKRQIYQFLKVNKIDYKKIDEPSAEQIDLDINTVKITFFASGFDFLKSPTNIHFKNIEIASLELIAAMKVYTLSLRGTFRDYYDLYVLNKEKFSVRQLYDIARQKQPVGNFKLFCQQLIYTRDIEEEDIKEHLLPRYKVTIDEIKAHFEKEVKLELEKIVQT